MMLALYRGLTSLGGPLISAYLDGRAARGKEDPARLAERRGHPGLPRPPGRLVWLHAASVGEAVSVLPVIERLQALPATTALLTTGTVTSARLMDQRLAGGAIHQYVPFDRPSWVRRFLDHWRPDLALLCESELWPNLVAESARRAPLILLNGRLSARSFARWRRHPRSARRLLGAFALCLAQSDADAERLGALGCRHVMSPGNLKYAAPPLPCDPAALEGLRAVLGARPRWLAASTHEGEEAIAGTVHRSLAGRFPGLLTVIVPRHPERGPEIAAALAETGLRVARRGAGEPVAANTDILLADTLGELGAFYRAVPIVFMGKSLAGGGGQNPLEPARLGAAVMFGPLMDNFAEIAGAMTMAEAATEVTDTAALAGAVARLLSDPAEAARAGAAARGFAEAEAGVLARVMAALEPFLAARAA